MIVNKLDLEFGYSFILVSYDICNMRWYIISEPEMTQNMDQINSFI